jgi:hypothetical protein
MNTTADRIIYVSLAVLCVFGLLSFVVNPIYEKGTWAVIAAVAAALSGALGFKFGVSNSKDDSDK